MILGIPYIWWLLGLGIVAVWLSMPSKKKVNDKHFGLFNDSGIAEGDIDGYIKSLQEITEMGWVRLRVNPEDLDTVLNMVEDLKISVLYQFFLREHKYDMLFRCQKDRLEEFKNGVIDYIPKH